MKFHVAFSYILRISWIIKEEFKFLKDITIAK